MASSETTIEPISDEVALGLEPAGPGIDGLDPRFRRLVEFAIEHVDLSSVPPFLQPLVNGAVMTLINRLASDPEGSRDSIIELVERAVMDLRISRDELSCWDADGNPEDS